MMDGILAAQSESSSQDEDSDDNFLYVQPAALQESSLLRFKKDPTETQITAQTDDLEPVESTYSIPSFSTANKLKYPLDCIVQTNNSQDQEDAQLANLHESLHHDIVAGGITKMVEEEQEDDDKDFPTNQEQCREFGGESATVESRKVENVLLLPEHEKTLQQYALQKESITPLHPGEDVFSSADMGKLFTFPVELSLSEANAMERLIMTSSPDELEELLMSRIVLDMYTGKKCPDSVMLWLLQLLSISNNVLVSGMIFDTMWSLMNLCQHVLPSAKPWCPLLPDIAAIFVNYGARWDSLLPPSLFRTNFTMDGISARYCQSKKHSKIPECETRTDSLPGYNLQQVIKIITQCLLTYERNPSLSGDDLISLAYMVCRISLDKQLIRCPVQVDFQHCIAAILNCFQDQTWTTQATTLCRKLTLCSDHHHNLVHLVRLMWTGTWRGNMLCRMLSRSFLEKLTSKHREVELQCARDIQAFQVSDLIPILAACKPRGKLDTDYYQLHSIIILVELAVGYDKDLYQTLDKEALARVVIMLRDMAGNIRESHKHLCRTQVKDLLIRIASGLTYLEQTLTGKQARMMTL